jgi:casein kinase II subunit beta
MEKYKQGEFGQCPRTLCNLHHVLPVGTTDIPLTDSVKVYCPNCEDLYLPKATRFIHTDGAYFGTSFPHMLMQVFPDLKPSATSLRYIPRIYGFKVHGYTRILCPAPPEVEGAMHDPTRVRFDHESEEDSFF